MSGMSAMGKIGNYGKLWKTALDVSLRAAQEIYYLFTCYRSKIILVHLLNYE